MELTRLLGYCGGSFAVGFVSGLVPAVNTEAYLLALVALAPSAAVAPCRSRGASERRCLPIAIGKSFQRPWRARCGKSRTSSSVS